MRTLDKPSCGDRFPTDVQPVPGGFVTLVSHLLDFLSSASCGVHARVMTGSEACELCPSSGPTREGGPLPLREREVEGSFGAVNVPLSPCWYGLSWTGRNREGAGPCQGWYSFTRDPVEVCLLTWMRPLGRTCGAVRGCSVRDSIDPHVRPLRRSDHPTNLGTEGGGECSGLGCPVSLGQCWDKPAPGRGRGAACPAASTSLGTCV